MKDVEIGSWEWAKLLASYKSPHYRAKNIAITFINWVHMVRLRLRTIDLGTIIIL